MILFNPTIPHSVPRSNNLTSSPDKRGFPTRNAASPVSSYLSCLLSHHVTKNTKTTVTNTTSQHNTHLLSLVIFPAFTSRCTQQHTTTTTTTLTTITTTTTTHKNSTDQNQNNTGNHNITKNFDRTKLLPRMKSFSSKCILLMSLSDALCV